MPSNFYKTPKRTPLQLDTEFLQSFKDHEFDQIYSASIREMSVTHWSPVNVCRLAAKLLVTSPATRVLDVGCGPGKFCVIGATTTRGHFTGVEQRKRLARAAKDLIERYGIIRAEIAHANILDVSFLDFNAFYIFNPFAENVFPSMRIDFEVELHPGLYAKYIEYVNQQLSRMPIGTRVVTYCGDGAEVPGGYECEKMACLRWELAL
jgi:SAM-dependent methyltransferase